MTPTQLDPSPVIVTTFRHEAMFYSGDDAFLAGTVPFLTDAIAAEQPALVVVSEAHIDLLRSVIVRSGDYVSFADMSSVGRNPARIIPAWRKFLDSHASDGRPVRGIGEPIWPTRTPAEVVECHRHEALLNVAFAKSSPWWLMCPYDVEALGPQVVDEAVRTHPFIRQAVGESVLSTAFRAEQMSATHRSAPLSEPTRCLESMTFRMGQLALVRSLAEARASQFGLTESQLDDLVLAVHEIAANSVRHGGGQGRFRLWREGRSLVAEISDRGTITDPLAGRAPRSELGAGPRALDRQPGVRPRAAPHLSDRLGRAPVHLPRRHLTDPFLQSRSCTSGNRARCCWSEPRISQSIMHSAESGADAEQPSPAPSRASANVDQIASTVIPCPQGAAHLASSPALPWR